jgi:hypothetical protein
MEPSLADLKETAARDLREARERRTGEHITRVQLWCLDRKHMRDHAIREAIRLRHRLTNSHADILRLVDLVQAEMLRDVWVIDDALRSARWWLLEAQRGYDGHRDEDGLCSWQQSLLYVRTQRWFADAVARGARFAAGGRRIPFCEVVRSELGVSWERWRSQLAAEILDVARAGYDSRRRGHVR